MRMRYLIIFHICVLLFASCAFAERPSQNGKMVLFGNLHAHPALLDEVLAEIIDDIPPKRAFEYTHQHGFDFLAITGNYIEKGLFTPDSLKLTSEEYKNPLLDVAVKYNSGLAKYFIPILSMDKIKNLNLKEV